MNSTSFLEPMLAHAGVMTKRTPSDQEITNITYGRAVAHHVARFDIGQTVVIAEAACVSIEAMEGTDAAILRAGELMQSLHGTASTFSRALTVVKVAKPNQDMRFDVPVVGIHTIESMRKAGASCLALDADKCLMLDKEAVISSANEAGIAIIAEENSWTRQP
jgi:UDP-2,3-diacylglucosamine hydrolase